MTTVILEHIQITPDVCGGKPRIADHRIRVQDIVIWYEHLNMSPDDIVYHYPSITLADVHAALTYYYDHLTKFAEISTRAKPSPANWQPKRPPSCNANSGKEMSGQIKFHLDENVSNAVAEGLRRRAIDVTTTPEQNLMGASDLACRREAPRSTCIQASDGMRDA
ncbi:DUF433 domain-containing protein [Altericista sp. CCNU0014]|uniref:DUF433 domain-containing protein n=1 Tax=Altericista sp. CCNU0014 TaxID=3082949 RepID=UPI00384CC6A2